jgi:hypothetical protein
MLQIEYLFYFVVSTQTPDTISIKVEEDIGGGLPAVG